MVCVARVFRVPAQICREYKKSSDMLRYASSDVKKVTSVYLGPPLTTHSMVLMFIRFLGTQ